MECDPPGELTVPQTDTGEQVEYTRALERTMSKELGKMTPNFGNIQQDIVKYSYMHIHK